MRKILCSLFVLTSAASIALAQTSEQQPCAEHILSAMRIERPAQEWSLDFIKKEPALNTVPFKQVPEGEDGIVATKYAVLEKSIRLPYLTFDMCKRTAVESSFVFKPEGVLGLQKSSHIFAYIVWGELVSGTEPSAAGVGAKMNVIFYDVHGHGHFDTVQVAAPAGLPFVPNWVKEITVPGK